jgi:sugar phosphate isomerase/epimerase
MMASPTVPIDRLGVCSWSLRPESAAALVTAIRDLGLPLVQLALDPVAEKPEAFGDAITLIRDAGMEVASGMLEAVGEDYSTLETIAATGGVRLDEHWPATRERARVAAAMAGEFGIPLVTMHAGFIPHDATDPGRAIVLDRLREIADLFQADGVKLGLETGQESAATLVEALDALDHPNVGVNFDPANMILYGMGDPVEAIRTLASRVVQVHAKDATPTATPGTWGAEVPLGTGAVDWDTFLPEVLAISPAVNVIIEREAGDDRAGDIAVAKTRLTGG